jgi:Ca-activated chloride channel homolog
LDFQFQYPQAFWLLAIVPLFLLFYLLHLVWKRRRIRSLGNEKLVRSLMASHSSTKSNIKFFLVLFAFAAGCLALANPRKPDPSSAEARKGTDVVIALDISNSMLAADLAPDRLSRAKQFLAKLIERLKDDRIGLVIFAGNAYLQMPLTFDQSAARLYISSASPNTINTQGTSITDALQKSEIGFGEESERFKSIILITDGETHDEEALDKAKELSKKGVMINTVGIGSVEGSTIQDTATGGPRKDEGGQVIISKLNQDLLQKIAAATNGTYVHLESSEAAVNQVMEQYTDIEKKALGDTSLFNYQTFYMWVVAPMLLLLLIDLLMSNRKKQKA